MRLSLFDKFLALILALIVLACFIGALAPVTGNDALAYHLFHPKLFVQQQRIGYIQFSRESMWPYLSEMLYTLAICLKVPSLATFFHYFFGVLSMLAVFTFTRRFILNRAALLCAVLFYSAPGIFMQSVYAYVDLVQCFYSFAAFYALMLWRNDCRRKTLILSGFFAGLALAVKVLSGITFILILAIMLGIEALERKSHLKKWLSLVFLFGICAFLACAVWYIRSYLMLGNPVYPFLHNIFHSGWETHIGEEMGTRRDLVGFLRLPWDLVMRLDSFGGEQIGVIFLALFPFIFFNRPKDKVIQYLAVFIFFYTLIWFIVDPNIRFAFVNLAAIFILIGCGLYQAQAKYRLALIKITLILVMIFNAALSLYYNREAIKLTLGAITPNQYLNRLERTYPIAEYVNRNLPLDALLILADECRGFYFDRKTIYYPIWKEENKDTSLSIYLAQLIRGGAKIYLLSTQDTINADPVFQGILGNKNPLYQIERVTAENEKHIYLLYAL
jgi:hypothetical protein